MRSMDDRTQSSQSKIMSQESKRPKVDNFFKPSILAWRARYQASKAENPSKTAEETSGEVAIPSAPKLKRDRRPIPGRNRVRS